MNFIFPKLFFLFLISSFISSCMGSSKVVEEIENMSLYDINSTENSALELVTVEGTTLKLSTISGNLVRDGETNSLVFNDINYKDVIPIKNLTSYVTIISEGNPINGSFGILGMTNDKFSLPLGKHIYNGNAEVFINDGNALYGLTGNSQIVFDYDGSNTVITGEIKSLSGKKSFLNLSCRDCPASQIVDIIFPSGEICSNNRICFSEIELRNSNLDTALTNNHTLISDGSFYGPEGKEFGNIFSVSDTDNGSIEIRGATVVKKQDN